MKRRELRWAKRSNFALARRPVPMTSIDFLLDPVASRELSQPKKPSPSDWTMVPLISKQIVDDGRRSIQTIWPIVGYFAENFSIGAGAANQGKRTLAQAAGRALRHKPHCAELGIKWPKPFR